MENYKRQMVLSVLALAAGAILARRPAAGRADADASPVDSVAVAREALPATLPLPVVPDTLRTVPQRVAYLLRHFWDAADFGDPRLASNEKLVEQSFVDFLSLFPLADSTLLHQSVWLLMERAAPHGEACRNLLSLAEKYLYEAQSPMCCDAHYLPFVRWALALPQLTRAERERLHFRLAALCKNAPGSVAADFPYVTLEGEPARLHSTACGRRLLLVFYDPECELCTQLMQQMAADAALGERVGQGTLAVLALCVGDDKAAWKKNSGTLPPGWIAAMDAGCLQRRGLYVLRSLPQLYLLDEDKRVLSRSFGWEAMRQAME